MQLSSGDSPHAEEPKTWRFPALIERPAPELDRGLGVMLFAGGLANDLAWTMPGSYEMDGESFPLTISGEDTTDGDTLAAALVEHGFTVMRYASIRIGDPLHAADPAMAQAMGFASTLRLARVAWDTLLEQSGLAAGDVIVIGHSLGAARGVLSSGGKARGYVSLAGAYMSPTRERPSVVSKASLARLGVVDPAAIVTREAFDEFAAGAGDAFTHEFDEIDADSDGGLRGWELAAAWSLTDGKVNPDGAWLDEATERSWPSSLLEAELKFGAERLGKPAPHVLAVWGSLDTMSFHGPRLSRILPDNGLESRYFTDLGHNLGQERTVDGVTLTGPIDEGVVDLVVNWCAEQATD